MCVLLSFSFFLFFSRCSDFLFLLSFYHFPLSTSFFVVLHWFLTLRCPVDGFSHRIASIVSSDSVAYSHPILNPIRLFSFSCYRRLTSSIQYPIDIDRAIPRRRTACRPQVSFLCSLSLLDSEHQRIARPRNQHGSLNPPPRRLLRPPTHLQSNRHLPRHRIRPLHRRFLRDQENRTSKSEREIQRRSRRGIWLSTQFLVVDWDDVDDCWGDMQFCCVCVC